jgi:decaprenyl-phosphate phosphoribosyltransferase
VSVAPAALIRLARPRQWVKNGFVAAPLFFTPEALNSHNLILVITAVVALCLLSSAIYVFNDWCDRDADRAHPVKRTRPIASGAVPPSVGLAMAVVLLLVGTTIMLVFLPLPTFIFAAVYVASSTLYSWRLKHIAVLDVIIVASGFVLRVMIGAAAISVTATSWIVICTFLLALFLALAKRRDDLVKDMPEAHRPALAGYNARFLDTALGIVLAALLVSYLIYTTDPQAIQKFHTDKLYLTAPFVVAGVLRYLQIAVVEERSGSPTDVALTDRFLMVTVLGWLLTFGFLIYVR